MGGATLNAASYRRVRRCGVSWPFLRLRFLSIKSSDPEDGAGRVSGPLHTRPALSQTSHSDWRDQSTGTLEIWLDQKPVYHCCPVEDRPLSTSGQLPSLHRATTVSSVSLLRRRWRDGTASSSLLSVTRIGTYLYQLHQLNWSSMHVVLSGVDRGCDMPPPPTRNERTRHERRTQQHHKMSYSNIYTTVSTSTTVKSVWWLAETLTLHWSWGSCSEEVHRSTIIIKRLQLFYNYTKVTRQ